MISDNSTVHTQNNLPKKDEGKTQVNPQKIRNMFSRVAHGYDKANSVLSFGIHHLWRNKLVAFSEARIGQNVLDCATGTGDLAIAFKKVVGSKGHVIGTDFCAEMLLPAPRKAQACGMDIQFELADVTQLQYSDKRFDITSISFGIRNVDQPETGLKEMARVTKSGGYVIVLEFGQVNNGLFRPFYNFYSQKILPIIGGLLTGERDAYSYLQTSSAKFPAGKDFVDMMDRTKLFSEIKFLSLSFGIAYIYRARVR